MPLLEKDAPFFIWGRTCYVSIKSNSNKNKDHERQTVQNIIKVSEYNKLRIYEFKWIYLTLLKGVDIENCILMKKTDVATFPNISQRPFI